MTVRRFAKSRRLEVTTIEFVALSALTLTPDSKMRRAARPPGFGRRAAGWPRPRRHDLVERLRELDGVRVLQQQDVDLALARVRDVEPLDELEDAQVRALGADDDDASCCGRPRGSSSTWTSPPAAAPFSPRLAPAPPLRP